MVKVPMRTQTVQLEKDTGTADSGQRGVATIIKLCAGCWFLVADSV